MSNATQYSLDLQKPRRGGRGGGFLASNGRGRSGGCLPRPPPHCIRHRCGHMSPVACDQSGKKWVLKLNLNWKSVLDENGEKFLLLSLFVQGSLSLVASSSRELHLQQHISRISSFKALLCTSLKSLHLSRSSLVPR